MEDKDITGSIDRATFEELVSDAEVCVDHFLLKFSS
jgi:hypothetical protein